jgi:peptide/nickel transport system substrate-binding protein
MMANDRIILPILSPDNVLVYRKGLEGLRISACCNLVLSDIAWK